MKTGALLIVLSVLLGLSSPANAALIDRGNGLIYDTVQDITWFQNVDYAGTAMTFNDAQTWVDNLSYAGYNDWRLPTGPYIESLVDPGDSLGGEVQTIILAELGNMEMAPLINAGPFTNLGPGCGFWTSKLYTQADWEQFVSSMGYPGDPASTPLPWYWIFNTSMDQYFLTCNDPANQEAFVWAVRDGDTRKIPEPGTLLLLGSGLAGLGLFRRKAKKVG